MTKKLRRPDMQYLDDGTYRILAIRVKNREEAADVREQIIDNQTLLNKMSKILIQYRTSKPNELGPMTLISMIDSIMRESGL